LKNKFGIILEARMGSTRLPGKTLKDLLGKPMIERILDRLFLSKLTDTIVVATTENKKDDVLVSFLEQKEINYFRGSEDDVLKRVVEAAEHFSIQNIIELHGDNPFLDPDIIDSCIREFELGDVDYLSNTLENTFPQGLRVQIFPTVKLRRVEKTVDDETVREHVSLYFYENPNKFKIKSVEAEDPIKRPELRLTVDTEEDFQFICSIYERLLLEGIYPDFDVKDIIRIVDDYKISIVNKSIKSKPIR